MTDADAPIACTLTPDELGDRRALWERIDPSVQSRTGDEGGFRIVYRATEDVARLLPSLAAAEADCCGFATWTVTREDDALVLAVTGPEAGIEALPTSSDSAPATADGPEPYRGPGGPR